MKNKLMVAFAAIGVAFAACKNEKNVSENVHATECSIDSALQDTARSLLIESMQEELTNASDGLVMVMETKTGEVKALVDLQRTDNGIVDADSGLALRPMEYGQLMTPASILVAMKDGVNREDTVDCEMGQIKLYGCTMVDHNYSRGGYGILNIDEVLMYSSNIGVAKTIEKLYKNDPERFCNRLRQLGLNVVKDPTSITWTRATLPWLSIGYENTNTATKILAFYNAIANGGQLIEPKMTKGEEPKVLIESIADARLIANMREILTRVVNEGLCEKAMSENGFLSAGKQGTASIIEPEREHIGYLVSFCGFFPAEAPEYTCIVCLKKSGQPASGSKMCAPLFRAISEYLMQR